MSVHKLLVIFEADSELPADAMVNTLYFEGSGSDPENVFDMVFDFFDADPTGLTSPISEYMSNAALTGQVTFKLYDLADAEPRVPVAEETRTLANISSSAALPTEVALVFSYHSAFTSGTAAARSRGRIYIGGLAAFTNTNGRPASTLTGTMAAAGRDLIQASNASVSWEWQQYSTLTETGRIAVGGWVDNAWDTQRRRGLDSTVRTTFTGGTP